MCEFCNRHLNNGKECGKAYPIQPCASGDLGVRAEYIDGGIVLFKDHNFASGYFDINYCPICGRKVASTEEQQHKTAPGVPHICMKYGKRVFHRSNKPGYHGMLFPCKECEDAERTQSV